MKLSDLGARGLVIWDGEKYRYCYEATWRANRLEANDEPVERLKRLTELQGVVALISQEAPKSVFVDFRHLKELRSTPVATQGPKTSPPSKDEPTIYIHEAGEFYKANAWEDLTAGGEGDAGVVVRRGGVVATIPGNDIPAGTLCVLVNLHNLGV